MILGLFAFSVISKSVLFFGNFEDANIVTVLLDMLFYLLTLVFIITVFIITAAQFYRSMVTDEAYTTFSLPISTKGLIFAKLISSVLTDIIAIIVVSLSNLIIYSGEREMSVSIQGIWDSIILFSKQAKLSPALILMLLVAALFLTLITYNLFVEAAVAIGQTFENNKLGFSVLGGIVLYLILTVVLLLITFVIEIFVDWESNMFYKLFLSAVLLCMLIGDGFMFIFVKKIFANRLNLE